MSTTAGQIITDVRNEILETNPAFWTDTELIRHINRAQRDYCNKVRFLENASYFSSSVGSNQYNLPADFISVKALLHNVPDINGNANWKRVRPSTLEKTVQERVNFPNTTTNNQGRPSRYWIWDGTLYVDPAPSTENSSSNDFYLWYKSKPTTITSSSDLLSVPDELAEGITEYVLWKVWLKEQEKATADEHAQNYVSYINEGRRWIKRQSGDQRNRLDIESPIGYYGINTPFNPLG